MPEQLNPELLALRDRCATFAREHMLPLADLDYGDAAAKIRAASKQVGLFSLTQPDGEIAKDARQLALCVARETLAAANPPAMEAVFGPSAGVLGHVSEPLASTHLAPYLPAKSAAVSALPSRMTQSLPAVLLRVSD